MVTYAPAARTFVCENTIQVYRFVSLSQQKSYTPTITRTRTHTLSLEAQNMHQEELCARLTALIPSIYLVHPRRHLENQ